MTSRPPSNPPEESQRPEALVIPPDSAIRRTLGSASRLVLLLTLPIALFWRGGVSVDALLVVIGLGLLGWVLSWAVRPRDLPRARFAWLWLGLGAYTVLQLIPLPRALVATIQPGAVEISDLGRATLGLAPLDMLPIAVAWGDAALQAALYLGLAGLAVTAAITVQIDDGRRLMRQLAQLIVWLAAASGCLWLIAHEPNLAGLIPLPLREQAEALVFVNENHQAGLLVVGLALALGQVLEVRNERLQNVFRLVATFLGLTILLVGSRGGVLIAFVMLGLTGATLPRPDRHMRRDEWERRVEARQRGLLITLSIVVALVVLAMPVLEVEFGVVGAYSLDEDVKVKTVQKMLPLFGDGWLFGQAPGTLPVVFGIEYPEVATRVDFAENLIAQRLFDGGLWGGLPFLAVLAWLLGSMVRMKRHFNVYTPMWIALFGLTLTNMVDFSLEVGGGLIIFLALALGAERTWPTRRSASVRGRRAASARLVVPGRLAAGLALAVSFGLLLSSHGRLSRDVGVAFAELSADDAKARLVADGQLYNHHALYLTARKLIAASRHVEALPFLDRAITLRPASQHARLFRLTIHLRQSNSSAAADDLAILLKPWNDTSKRALDVCLTSPLAKELLVDVITRDTANSYRIGQLLLRKGRPALVEEVALALRKAYPDKRFNIEGLRGRVYVRRGLFAPARRISAALMSRRETELAGWQLEGHILAQTGQPYAAYHLFREVCKRWPSNWEACASGVHAVLAAKRPTVALDYIRSQFSIMRVSPAKAGFYWSTLARAYLQLNRADDAIAAAERVLGYDRGNHQAQMILVKARLMIGDNRSAEALVKRLLKSQPGDADTIALAEAVTRAGAVR